MWAASWQNQQNWMCAQRRLRSAWATARSDQSSLSAWRKLGSLAIHWAHSKDSDQTGRTPGWPESSLGSHHFVGFVVRWLIYIRFIIATDLENEQRHDKTNKMSVRPAKISLGIRTVWSESSLCAQWVAKGIRFLHADSDQTGWMSRLIWVFAGSSLILLVLSCRGSNEDYQTIV